MGKQAPGGILAAALVHRVCDLRLFLRMQLHRVGTEGIHPREQYQRRQEWAQQQASATIAMIGA
jgi:hypothetical protein